MNYNIVPCKITIDFSSKNKQKYQHATESIYCRICNHNHCKENDIIECAFFDNFFYILYLDLFCFGHFAIDHNYKFGNIIQLLTLKYQKSSI